MFEEKSDNGTGKSGSIASKGSYAASHDSDNETSKRKPPPKKMVNKKAKDLDSNKD